jgi:branched-chain amino acid transport system permease protein
VSLLGRPSLILAALAALIALAPAVLSEYGLVLGFGFFVAAGLAIAWNMVGGFAGQFALGHSMYVGIGSYSVALLTTRTSVPLLLAIATGGLLSAALAAASAALFLRMRDAYFSVATMGLALACMAVVVISPSLGATAGIVLPGELPVDDLILFWAAGAMALVTLAASMVIRRSPFGLSLMAVRDDEQAAAESGVNPLLIKCLIMAVSGASTGLFGGLVALQKLTVEPYSAFGMMWSIQMIIMTVIGGLGSVWGPAAGAALVYGLQQALDELPVWNLLITALVLIAVIRLAPGGLVQLAAKLLATGAAGLSVEDRDRTSPSGGSAIDLDGETAHHETGRG